MNATIEHYQNEYNRLSEGNQEPKWLRDVRGQALQAFVEQGIPTRKAEQWKYNRLTELQKIDFKTAGSTLASVDKGSLPLSELDAYRIILNDGLIDLKQSDFGALEKQISLSCVSELDENTVTQLHQKGAGKGFEQLNTALFNRGLIITVPDSVTLDKPLLMIHTFSSNEAAQAIYSKSVIRMAKNSEMTLIEAFTDISDNARLLNSELHVFLDKAAVLKQIKIQANGGDDYHLMNTKVQQETSSDYQLYSFAMGGSTARNDVQIELNGEDAKAQVNGLYCLTNSDEADHHLLIEHKAPNCQSLQNFKAIVQERGHGIFNGKVIVHSGADGTDAQQSNHNMLLSASAEMDTKPELEIYADDVKCAHGATVGSLDEDALFYLRSRGIEEDAAKQLLIAAFADEIVQSVPEEAVIPVLSKMITEMLNKEEVL